MVLGWFALKSLGRIGLSGVSLRNSDQRAPYGYELCEAFCVIVDMLLAVMFK